MKFRLILMIMILSNSIIQCTKYKNSKEVIPSEQTQALDSILGSSDQKLPLKKASKDTTNLMMNEVVVLSNAFYACLKNQDYNGANANLHPDAVLNTPIMEWTKIYQNAQAKKGVLGFVNMYDHALKLKLNASNGLGDYVELIFDAQYKDGNMREKLTFYRKDRSAKFKILAYEYNEIVDKIYISDIFR